MLYDFGALQKDIRQWEDKAGRPAAVIGRSVCGRPLYGLWMGSGQETAVILAGFHGMEWITSAVLMDYAHHCLRVPPPVRVLMVPMVNPDGVEISLHGAQTAGPYAPQVRNISPAGRQMPGVWTSTIIFPPDGKPCEKWRSVQGYWALPLLGMVANGLVANRKPKRLCRRLSIQTVTGCWPYTVKGKKFMMMWV